MKDKISIAIATYNGGEFLREQLNSIYEQSIQPDEIVVFDDSSMDNTHEILDEFSKKSNFFFHVNEVNLGVNKNFEKAIKKCTGDYILICDQDDIWFINKVEILYKKIKEIEGGLPAVVSSQVLYIDKNKNIIPSTNKVITKDSFGYKDTLLNRVISQGCTMILNKRLMTELKSFPAEKMLYDIYIAFVASMIGIKYNLSIPLTYYRRHDNNFTLKHKNENVVKNKILDNYLQCRFPFFIPMERTTTIPEIYEEYSTIVYNKQIVLLIQRLRSMTNSSSLRICHSIIQMDVLKNIEKIKIILNHILGRILQVLFNHTPKY